MFTTRFLKICQKVLEIFAEKHACSQFLVRKIPHHPPGYVTDTDIGRLKAVIACRQQGFLGITNVVNYIGNHDRMLVELGTVLMLVSINRNYFY